MKTKLLSLFIIVVLSSCADNGQDKSIKRPGENSVRIIGKEYTVYKGYGYQIIEIDGQEYVSTSAGGICPLVKKDSL